MRITKQNNNGLASLLAVLAQMPRSYMEQGKTDWLHDKASLAQFSDASLKTVAADLEERWLAVEIRCRPHKLVLLDMLEAAQAAELALQTIIQKPRRRLSLKTRM